MTREDKQLLLKDLCARLPYGVKCIVTKSRTEEGQEGDFGKIGWVCLEGVDCIGDREPFFSEFGNFKPYLIPLSSMTEEQRKELINLINTDQNDNNEFMRTLCRIEFYHKYHFDYRGLIPMGLAIDATGLNIY